MCPRPTTQSREIRTFRTRVKTFIQMPLEMQMYQRFTNRPHRYSGPQFNTYYRNQHRWNDRDGIVDYMNWGKINGQAFMPHRHQRVVFDFHDTMHPTKVTRESNRINLRAGDPSVTASIDGTDSEFDPYKKILCWPIHDNMFMGYTALPHQRNISRSGLDSNNGQNDFLNHHSILSRDEFGAQLPANYNVGSVPGVHKPYLGEADKMNMESMAQPIAGTGNAICENVQRFSRSLYLNRPEIHNQMHASTCFALEKEIDRACSGLRTKMVVLKGAHCGLTDYFNRGLDFEEIAFNLRMADDKNKKAATIQNNSLVDALVPKTAQVSKANLEAEAEAHLIEADAPLRGAIRLLWRVFAAGRPFLTLINGKCRGVGCGVALMAKYPGLQDATEFVHDGPEYGLTPFGGMTHLLSRTETTLKYPGLAEFVMLTGFPLYAGDALRLGWSDLFTTLPDMDYHIRDWFNDTEHMHNDAVAWQVGHLLDSTFRMKEQHSTALERTSLTATRVRWIEEVFSDQPSIESILETLSAVEKMSLSESDNTADDNLSARASLPSVEAGLDLLKKSNLHFSTQPWDSSTSEEREQVADIFTQYFYELSRSGKPVVTRPNIDLAAKWQKMRQDEYLAYKSNQRAHVARTVHVRLDGCEGKNAVFNFTFNAVGMSLDKDPSAAVVLKKFNSAVSKALGFKADRPLKLLWNLPTLETAAVHRDDELFELLYADPGIEGPVPNEYPPIYFVAVREKLHFSEWAFSVKHGLLLCSPFALKASLALLHQVRGDGTCEGENPVKSVSQSLALEYRYLARLIRRRDFYATGEPSQRAEDIFLSSESDVVNQTNRPLRPKPPVSEIFERNVEIDGHRFPLRVKWSPSTISAVDDSDIAALAEPLDLAVDGVTEINPPIEADLADRTVDNVLNEELFEVVPRLGEKGVVPMRDTAHVPQNVDFYRMARHPFKDHESSWRSHGYTEGSEAYFKAQYEEAFKKTHDPSNQGNHEYWPQSADRSSFRREKREDTVEQRGDDLLRDRFWNVLEEAGREVESWAMDLKNDAKDGRLNYDLEVPTAQETTFDDYYYRWFVTPGVHPNPSGVIKGK